MKTNHIRNFALFGILITAFLACSNPADTASTGTAELWPEVTSTMKPWTRWWWMGNAVDKENITKRLEEFSKVGIGGVEITPIFGVKGYEEKFLRHLSSEWMEMLIHTLDEADRLGLGVDMVMGTGWPYGGPQVEPEFAAGKMYIQTYTLKAGEKFGQRITFKEPDLHKLVKLQYLFAFDKDGQKKELTSLLVNENLEWTPDNDYVLYAIFLGRTGQQVKRSAPGGEGLVLDHFSKDALRDYLEPYENSLIPVQNRLRALFNDSYEVYGADYTPRLFTEFQKRRGYDLADHIPQLIPETVGEDALRVLADYRETISDLVLEDFSENWSRWAREHSFKTKYQAHGCPGNLLDIYATADIPECESFYGTQFNIPGVRWEASDANKAQPDLIMLKFASSAAHISGKKLTSSETLTWLREHFKTALSQCKPEVEQIFLSGVNHVFFHGSTYFPDEAEWPGWKFYASVNFVPTSTLWTDSRSMFEYITRCQSMLQSGRSDNEILVYWPFHDIIGENLEGQLLLQLGINNKDEWLVPTPFYQLVTKLMEQGYSVDFVSDRYLKEAVAQSGKISLSGMEYEALVVPECRNMTVESFKLLAGLSASGGKVVFEQVPETVPGYHMHEKRTDQLQELIRESENAIIICADVTGDLIKMRIVKEALKDLGMDFIRRELEDGKIYYLVNHTPHEIDGYIPLNCHSESVMIMDPQTGKSGLGEMKSRKKRSEVYIQLKPGESLILRTFETEIYADNWLYLQEKGAPVTIAGTWELEFISGGPAIPETAHMDELQSWTSLSNQAEAFSGTVRYKILFDNPDPEVTHWLLDLGDVRESARVWINEEYMGCLWSVPFSAVTDKLREGENRLEIEVTNLSANRISDLERRGIEWKIFYEINMVNRHYKKFDATEWDPMPSGLLGEVSITPMHKKVPGR